MADPAIGTGEVLVDVAAAPVLSYADEVFSGARRYLLPTPVVPGCGAIGRVRAVGPDATRLRRRRLGALRSHGALARRRADAGYHPAGLERARRRVGRCCKRYFRDGDLRPERARADGERRADRRDRPGGRRTVVRHRHAADRLWRVAGDGLSGPGETLLVSGATGNFGAATVAAALAMGARCVVAPGRNAAVLDDLRRRFGERLAPVTLTGDGAADTAAMRRRGARARSTRCRTSCRRPWAPSVARAAIMTLRQGGRAVLMGGVGMLGGEDLALPYPWIMRNLITLRGQWMYDTAAVPGLVGLIRGGLLDLRHWAVTEFALEEASDGRGARGGGGRAVQADCAQAIAAAFHINAVGSRAAGSSSSQTTLALMWPDGCRNTSTCPVAALSAGPFGMSRVPQARPGRRPSVTAGDAFHRGQRQAVSPELRCSPCTVARGSARRGAAWLRLLGRARPMAGGRAQFALHPARPRSRRSRAPGAAPRHPSFPARRPFRAPARLWPGRCRSVRSAAPLTSAYFIRLSPGLGRRGPCSRARSGGGRRCAPVAPPASGLAPIRGPGSRTAPRRARPGR